MYNILYRKFACDVFIKTDLKLLIKKSALAHNGFYGLHLCIYCSVVRTYRKIVYELKTIKPFNEMLNDSITHHNKYHIIICNA